MEPPPPPKLTSLPPSSLIALHLQRKQHAQQREAAPREERGPLLPPPQASQPRRHAFEAGRGEGPGGAMHGGTHVFAQPQQWRRHRPESAPRRSAKRDADEHMDTLPEDVPSARLPSQPPWRRATSDPIAFHSSTFSNSSRHSRHSHGDDLSLDDEQPCKLRSPYRPNRDRVYARTLELLRRGAKAVQREAPSLHQLHPGLAGSQFSDSSCSAPTPASSAPMEVDAHQLPVTSFAVPRPAQAQFHASPRHDGQVLRQQQPVHRSRQQTQPQAQQHQHQHQHQPSLWQVLHTHPAQRTAVHTNHDHPACAADGMKEGEAEVEEMACRVCQQNHPVSHMYGCAFCDGPACAACSQPCAGCGYSFCSLCCVANFDEQRDRYFCLSCLQQDR